MATASVQPSDTECPVCHENFSTPKILPCAHLLCRHCLVTWLNSDADAQCPLCRDVIADATERAGKSCDDIADSLPTDLAMEARVECAAILSKDHVCSGCDTTPATSICLNCGDMMCTVCTKTHKKFSMSKHHDVEDLATMTAERLAANRRLPCSVHADKTSELYCPTHGAVICQLCATSKHRACPEVTELEEKMQEARAVLAELAATLKAGESKLEGAISELDQYLVDMEKATQAALADIDRKCDRLQSSVEAFRKRMKQLAKGANSEAKKRVEEIKSGFMKRRGRVTSHCRLVDRVGDRMPRVCGVSDMTSTLHTRVKGIDLSVTLPAELKVVAKKTVVIDEKALARIERELSQLGQLSVKAASTPSAPGVTGDMAALQAVGQTTRWRFHTNHGKNIVLSNNQQTAERVRGYFDDAIVISSEAMTTNTLYEVRLDVVKGSSGFGCGVTDGDPATLTVPSATAGWKEAVTIGWNFVRSYGVGTDSTVGKSLYGLREGSRVGVLVDTANSLHLYVDGQHQGVAARNIRHPCHAFFRVCFDITKISTLPLTTKTT